MVWIRGLALLAVTHHCVWPVRVDTRSIALTHELLMSALFCVCFNLISFKHFLPWCVLVCRGLEWVLRTVLLNPTM